MADSITDNRTTIDAADAAPASAPGWTDLGSSFTGITLDNEIFIEGSGSIGEYATTTTSGIFYEFASDTDLSNNHIYVWVNCGVVGLLATKANQGLTFRARGPTSSNYKEWDLAGSDNWPPSVQGGWTLFCIDLESTVSRNGGTPPATTAIRSLGVTFITAATMPRMVDNTWVDAMYRVADGTAAILVQGKNGGTTAWTWADFPTQLGIASGLAFNGAGGSVVLTGPVDFFVDDATDHAFNSTNELVLWDDQEHIASDFYGITIVGAATGSSDFTMGVKAGTGSDATGSQGGTIAASSSGVRWFWDSDGANIDTCNMYGVQCIHGADFQIDTTANSWISTSFVDCNSATVSNAEILRCSVINANTADGVAFMTTDDITDIEHCDFSFSDGHGVELTTPIVAAQTSTGNNFVGYGAIASNDAAIYNNAGGSVTITLAGDATSGEHTYRNGTSATTTVSVSVPVTITVVDEAGNPVVTAQTSVYLSSDNSEVMNADTNGSGVAATTFTGATPAGCYIRVRKTSTGSTKYFPASTTGTIASSTGIATTVVLREDTINST